MFEITKIRARRLKKLAIYGLAIYGVISLVRGCENETFGYQINQKPASRVEYSSSRQDIQSESVLETKLEDMYVR